MPSIGGKSIMNDVKMPSMINIKSSGINTKSIMNNVQLPSMMNMKKTMGGFGVMTKQQKAGIKKNGLNINLFFSKDKSMIPMAMDCSPFNKRLHNAELEPPEVYTGSDEDQFRYESNLQGLKAKDWINNEESEEEVEEEVKPTKRMVDPKKVSDLEEYEEEQSRGFFGNIGHSIKEGFKSEVSKTKRDLSKSFGYAYEDPETRKIYQMQDVKSAGQEAMFKQVPTTTVQAIMKRPELTLAQKESLIKKITGKTVKAEARAGRMGLFGDLKAKRDAQTAYYRAREKKLKFMQLNQQRQSQQIPQRTDNELVSFMKSGYVSRENENFSNNKGLSSFMITGKKKEVRYGEKKKILQWL